MPFWSLFLAGVWYDDPKSVELAKHIASKECVDFKGLYIHEGDTYSCQGEDSIKDTTLESWRRLNIFYSKWVTEFNTNCEVTPVLVCISVHFK